MFLFPALRLRLHDRYQTLFTSSCSECLSFWLQGSWVWPFCLSAFLVVAGAKWLHHGLVLVCHGLLNGFSTFTYLNLIPVFSTASKADRSMVLRPSQISHAQAIRSLLLKHISSG